MNTVGTKNIRIHQIPSLSLKAAKYFLTNLEHFLRLTLVAIV